jgi:hypothetical protein
MNEPEVGWLEVGTPYGDETSAWHDRTTLIHFDRAGLEIVVFYASPNNWEIDQFGEGVKLFAWTDLGDAAILSYLLGPPFPMMDASFHPCRVRPEDRQMPMGFTREQAERATTLEGFASVDATKPRSSEGLWLVRAVLVDTVTRTVAALKAMWLPTGFTAAVGATLSRMMLEGLDEARELAALKQALDRYPDPARLYEAAPVKCVVGKP